MEAVADMTDDVTRLNIHVLSDLIRTLRDALEPTDSNRFGVGIASQVINYAEMLNVILTRYETASAHFIANTKENLDAAKNKKPPPDLTENRRVYTHLRLEVESFYLFAKVLLDNIAQMTEFYFGSARGASLDSHDKLTKNFTSYAAQKGLSVPDGFLDAAKRLNVPIRFRDKEITHTKARQHEDGFALRGVFFDFNGKTRLANQDGRGIAESSEHCRNSWSR